MKFYQAILILVFSFSGTVMLSAQGNVPAPKENSDQDILPEVFILGEFDAPYESLITDYQEPLISVCDNNMDLAYDKWINMIVEMEAFASEIDFDINGVRVWLNIFWNKDGSIQHIAYHLKPNSRNVKYEEMTAFFKTFMKNYEFPVVTEGSFSHYGSASFPTFGIRLKKVGAQ